MEKKYDGFSMQEAMHLAQSDAGQQLLQLLRSNHGDAARSALEKHRTGISPKPSRRCRHF